MVDFYKLKIHGWLGRTLRKIYITFIKIYINRDIKKIIKKGDNNVCRNFLFYRRKRNCYY